MSSDSDIPYRDKDSILAVLIRLIFFLQELIQLLTTHEPKMSKVLDKGQHLLDDAETLRLSKDDRSRLDDDLRTLKTKWNELQENAFDTERRLVVMLVV